MTRRRRDRALGDLRGPSNRDTHVTRRESPSRDTEPSLQAEFLDVQRAAGLLRVQRAAGNRAAVQVATTSRRPAEAANPLGRTAAYDRRIQRQAIPAEADTTSSEGEKPAAYVPTEDDKKEFKLLPRNIKNAKGEAIGTVEEYVEYRHSYFGSAEAYETAKTTADAEFDKMKKSVWSKIGQKESKAAKRVLYRWLRKAYIDAGLADPVSVIKSGMTADLKKKLGEVKKKHADLKTGGFVARPKKLKGYKLGTVSEHGTGNAVDVTPQSRNPHFNNKEWKFILKFTSKTVDRSAKRWKKDPADVWRDIHDLNDAYVTELKVKVDAVKAERKKAGKPEDEPAAYRSVLKGQRTLIETAQKYGISHGFFDLDENLVVDFGKAGFTWGATFTNSVDLHHFEV